MASRPWCGQAADRHRPPGAGSPRRSVYSSVLKRGLDIVGAVVLLVVCAPAAAAVAAAVVTVLGFPVFHREQRAGRGGRPITIVKFRSMTDDRDADGALLPDEARLGRFGKLLRRTSLDELPQLAAVITGDLSLVGPRPLPMRYLPRYSPRQATRLLVRPGLTGWAQVHGRNQVDWPGRLELDAQYVEMSSRWYAPLVDGWIVVLTVAQVIRQALTGKGVAAEGHASMPEFFP
ncbi:MAG: sugar transferase [Planctomycetes bacterium]|nr:sugar transferase [Planctomycetota bacterium]